MSTVSAIAIKDENGITGIYCGFDGYLSGVGVYLESFYKDVNKVRELIRLGGIKNLGNFVTVPAEAQRLNTKYSPYFDFDNFTLHSADTYTVQYEKIGMIGDDFFKVYNFANEKAWCEANAFTYKYLYDTKNNSWYLIDGEVSRSGETYSIKRYKLSKLFDDYETFKDLFTPASEARNEFNACKRAIKEINTPAIKIYNRALKEKNICDLKFEYVEVANGNKIYALYKKNGKDNVWIATTQHVQVLMKMVSDEYGIAYDRW